MNLPSDKAEEVGRVASQPGSQPSASAAGASSPIGADPSRVSDILDRAADLIAPEGAWCQGSFARNSEGYAVRTESPLAVCFCAVGAIYRATSSSWIADRIIDELDSTVRDDLFTEWNDREGRTQRDVVEKLRAVAAKRREQGK